MQRKNHQGRKSEMFIGTSTNIEEIWRIYYCGRLNICLNQIGLRSNPNIEVFVQYPMCFRWFFTASTIHWKLSPIPNHQSDLMWTSDGMGGIHGIDAAVPVCSSPEASLTSCFGRQLVDLKHWPGSTKIDQVDSSWGPENYDVSCETGVPLLPSAEVSMLRSCRVEMCWKLKTSHTLPMTHHDSSNK